MSVLQRCCRQWYSLRREKCSKCGKSLSEKKHKTYGVDVYRGGRRERIVVGKNKTKAIQIDEQVRVRVREEQFEHAPRPIPFKRLVETYLQRLKDRPSERTARGIFRRLMAEWGGLKTNQITPAVIEAFRTKMLSEGKSQRWIDQHCEFARAAYNVHHLPNPFNYIQFFKPDMTVVRYLSRDERKALLTEMGRSPLYFQEMFVVALETGLRKNNVVRLRRDEVDFERRIIVVRISARSRGTKPHIVPLTNLVYQVLEDIPENGTPYFWINPKTGKPYRQINQVWQTLKKRAGITRPFRWHDLRHDFLTRILKATGSLRIAQELAGHSSPLMTQRYAHLIDESLRSAILSLSDTEVTHPILREKKKAKSTTYLLPSSD